MVFWPLCSFNTEFYLQPQFSHLQLVQVQLEPQVPQPHLSSILVAGAVVALQPQFSHLQLVPQAQLLPHLPHPHLSGILALLLLRSSCVASPCWTPETSLTSHLYSSQGDR